MDALANPCVMIYNVYRKGGAAMNVAISKWGNSIGIRIPVIFPAQVPSAEFPYELPVVSDNGMRYTVTFTSMESGKVRITGYVDFEVVGNTEINSDCALWKDGTQQPALASETKSGCDSGFGVMAVMMVILAGVSKFVWD